MASFPPFNPNVPNEPTKPPNIPTTVFAQPSPAIPNLTHGLTPQKSDPNLQNSLQCAKTVGAAPSVAPATSTGDPPTGPPPFDAPPLNGQFRGSIASQQLAHDVLQPGATRRAMPAPSGLLDASSPPPISSAPTSDALPSSQLIAPIMAQTRPSAAVSRTPLPAPQAPLAASTLLPN
ncbi:hypothetical protein Adt_03291 [Abeliophyllum distichum]|uniref:Uncharacterized protein n=1 Tax=Abeliophyllum distichum TaxID=126358 RepID=A0ABD1W0J6_9LAMI